MSMHRLEPCLSLPLEAKDLIEIISKSKDFALMHGAGIRLKESYNPDGMVVAPFALFPSSFPKKEFERAIELQPLINELTHKVAHNYEFLYESLKSTLMADDFTAKLFDIYEKVRHEGSTQALSLGLLRSDYFPQSTEFNALKQVEINTIASSLAQIATTISQLHRYVLSELGHADLIQRLPENRALQGLSQGLIDAWKLYNNPLAVILFVVEAVTYNICDQRFLEYEIRNVNSNVKVIRKTLSELSKEAELDGPLRKLVVDRMEIAVVYYRTGYVPSDYKCESDWDVRLMIERSFAIKCPSIHYHLAGCKKVQQSLTRPYILEKFLSSPEKASQVKRVFTGLYSLEIDESGNEAIERALTHPEKYVLKPQREGGGNNFYGKDVVDVLNRIKETSERNAFILMDKIEPPVVQNYLIKSGMGCASPQPVDIVSELGIYGVIIGDETSIFLNKQVGHMMRSKTISTNEGGVAAGFGFLDSPFIF